jgi:hypothetical protein
MRSLTASQMDMGRRQLEIERELIAQGMDPRDAAAVAARSVMSAGNGAEVDNLEAAATPLSVEPLLGSPSGAGRMAPPQSARVYQDDPTMGLAGVLAGREAAQETRDAARAAMYGQRTKEYVDEYGMIGAPGAAPLTQEQYDAREERKLREAEARHTPYEEDARIARLAERAGIPVEQAAAMVQSGYNAYAKQTNSQPWTVAGVTNTTERPDFEQMAYAHRALRQAGDTQRQADLAERKQAVIRRRMAQSNPLEYMNRPDISDWNRMIVANQLLGPRGYRGATPLDVDQAREQALALQQSRMALGEGFQSRTPTQQAAADAIAEAKRREVTDPRLLAREAAGRGEFNHPDIADAAERIVSRDYSAVTAFGNTSGFMDDEVTAAAQKLTDETGVPLEQSLVIMRRIQQERMRNFHLSP